MTGEFLWLLRRRFWTKEITAEEYKEGWKGILEGARAEAVGAGVFAVVGLIFGNPYIGAWIGGLIGRTVYTVYKCWTSDKLKVEVYNRDGASEEIKSEAYIKSLDFFRCHPESTK